MVNCSKKLQIKPSYEKIAELGQQGSPQFVDIATSDNATAYQDFCDTLKYKEEEEEIRSTICVDLKKKFCKYKHFVLIGIVFIVHS